MIAETPQSANPKSDTSPAVRIHLIGRFKVTNNSIPVSIIANKQIALLSYLTVANAPVARHELVSLLWPESSENAAFKNLRNSLWKLRGELGVEAVVNTHDSVSLDSQFVTSDIREAREICDAIVMNKEFTQAARLLDLVGGDVLANFSLSNTENYEHWLSMLRHTFNQQFVSAVTMICNSYLAEQLWHEAIVAATKGLKIDFSHEPFVYTLMKANFELGQRGSALQHYQQFKERLWNELSIMPSAEIESLVRIISGQATSTPQVAVRPMPEYTLATRFVGNSGPLQQLDYLLSCAQKQGPVIALLTGDIGIGKSRLAAHFLQQCRQAGYTAEAAWAQVGQHRSINLPLVNMTRKLIASANLRPTTTQKQILGAVMPEYTTLSNGGGTDHERNNNKLLLYETFAQLIYQSALEQPQTPLVLCLDNQWWHDGEPRAMLAYALNRWRTLHAPILLILAVRDNLLHTVHASLDWLHQLEREFPVSRIQLKPLRRDDIAQLLVAAQGQLPPDFAAIKGPLAEVLMQRSSGNAWLVTQLVRSCRQLCAQAETGVQLLEEFKRVLPPLVLDTTRVLLNKLPVSVRQLLFTMAIFDKPIAFKQLATLTSLTHSTLVSAIDTALAQGIIKETATLELAEAYCFKYQIEGEAYARHAGFGRKSALHERIAKIQETA